MVTGIVLCGGEGSRIKHLTDLPKCLVPYQGKPVIQHILEQFYQTGVISRIILLAADKRKVIIDALWPGGRLLSLFATHATVVTPQAEHIFPHDELGIGTLPALAYALPFIQTKVCVVVNGDTIVDYSLEQLLDKHYSDGSDVTVAVVERSSENVFEFVDSGVWVMNSMVLNQISNKYKLREDWLKSVSRRIKVGSYQANTFIDIGTPETFAKYCGGILNGRG